MSVYDYVKLLVDETLKLLNPETIEYYAKIAVEANKEEMKQNTLIPAFKQELSEKEKAINNLLKMVERGGRVTHSRYEAEQFRERKKSR